MRTYTLFIASAVIYSMTSVTAVAQTCNGPGKARWPIKTSLPEGANASASGKTIDLGKLLALPAAPGVKDNDKRFQDARIPVFDNDLHLKEGDLVTTTGWLYLVATEKDDCDYHIQISPAPRTTADPPQETDDCLIVEAPRPDFLSGDDLSAGVSQERDFIKSKLLLGKEPSSSGSVMQHAVCVKVTGQLVVGQYDFHRGSQAGRLVGNWRYEETRINRRGLAWAKERNGSRQSSFRKVLSVQGDHLRRKGRG